MILVMCWNSVFHIWLWLLLLLLAMSTVMLVTSQLNDSCINTTVSTLSYQENLFELLLELNSSSSSTRFHSTSAGQPPNKAYGQYLCRTSLEECASYISNSVQFILNNCPYQYEATIWYYSRTMIRFSNYSFFGEYKLGAPNATTCYENVVPQLNSTYDSDSFKSFMILNLLSVAGEVYRGQGGRMFDITSFNYTSVNNGSLWITVNVIAECTPDLSSDNCKSCLNSWAVNLPTECYASIDARVVYSSSCFIRYGPNLALDDFVPPDPTPTAAPVSLPSPADKGNLPITQQAAPVSLPHPWKL